MSLTFAQHQKAYSIRLMEQMKRPPLHNLALFNLPRNSALHYIAYGDDSIGIDVDSFLLTNQKDDIAVSFIANHSHPLEGNTLNHNYNVQTAVNDYFASHKRFKRLDKSPTLINNERVLGVYNYGLLDHVIAYAKLPVSTIHRFRNNFKTMLDNCALLAKSTSRQHYLLLEVPTLLPSVSVLQKAADMTDNSIIKRFFTYANFQIGELWNWLSYNRDHSVLGGLETETLSRINIIVTHGGLWGVFNLGVINNWRYADPKEKSAPGITRISPDMISKRFLMMLMIISETSTNVPDDSHYEDIDKTDDTTSHSDDDSEDDSNGKGKPISITDVNPSHPRESTALKGGIGKPVSTSLVGLINKGVNEDTLKTDAEIINEIGEIDDNDIANDLAALDKLEDKEQEVKTGEYKAYVAPDEDLTKGVTDAAMESVRKGRLSAAEFRRFEKLANRFKEIKNPFDPNEKLADMIKITPELLEVKETNLLADDIKGVIDKSMLSCSTKEMDKRYINKVLKKDIAAMVVNLQKMGFAVQDFSVERIEDYTDNLEIYSVKIVPVTGKPSTLRFKIPVINEDGTFTAGKVKYRMRRQRGDVPIRKTAHDTVALTSYYSKMFVTRSERAVFNRSSWLVNGVIAKAIDAEDMSVTDIRMNDVFDNNIALPPTYTTLSKRISSFKSGEYYFIFDYSKRLDILSLELEASLKQIAPKDNMLYALGSYKSGILLMDINNRVYQYDTVNNTLTDIGTIESIIGLDESKSPVEIAEVGIFGKEIPVGFVLGYHIGIGNLLKTLGCEYELVPLGTHRAVSSDEYSIRFQDFTLVLKRKDRVASLVMGGFNRYHRDIKQYSFYDFDRKDVYGNVMDENGLSARYTREFDLIFKLWVDPITRDLLIDMQEPTDLFNLFISACKKLLLDAHPQQMDNAYMRDKGYERLSGMLYFEMIKAVRGYAIKPANANASLDLNPEAVWMTILKDQTVMPIEESNPVHSLKEKEVVVYAGGGGRTARSMTEKARMYHENGMGVVSEATVDSGDVATITYLSADPNYTSLRGVTRRIKDTEGITAKLVSTSMMLAPAADEDDCF